MTHEERRRRREQIANYVLEGHTVKDACKEFGVCKTTVLEACKENGVVLERNFCPVHHKTLEIVADLINTDLSFHDLSRKYDLSYTRIWQIHRSCAAAGIAARPRMRGRPGKASGGPAVERSGDGQGQPTTADQTAPAGL